MKKFIYFALSIILLGLTTSCTSDDNAMDKGYTTDSSTTKPTIKVIETKVENFQFILYSNVKAFYAPSNNPVVVEIKDLNDPTNTTFINTKMNVVMHMPTMTHSAPMTQLQPQKNVPNKFDGELMFTMSGTNLENNYWEVIIDSENKGKKLQTSFKLSVRDGKFYDRQDINTIVNSDRKTLETFNVNSQKHYAALHPIFNPKTGNNEVAVTIYRNEKMATEFPIVENLIVSIDPRMPDMGNHGVMEGVIELSYNATTKQYEGTLPLSMTGYWFLNLVIKNQSGEIVAGQPVAKDPYGKYTVNGDKFFDILF
ncbi:MAG: FixH family protein [Flavobacteriaceae bacterium]|jgi:hypothetical protein|nr:FixH family protein [Flavobacteriaceae bacterium]